MIYLDVTDGMAQSVHEYLKKDFVFCLTINSGYAFYVQVNKCKRVALFHCIAECLFGYIRVGNE